MQDRFKYRAVLKTDRFVIIVPTDSICETGYQIDTNIAQKIFEDKYPDNCFFSDFLEIIEKQEYINQYSFDCDLLITKDFTNLMQCTSKKDKNGKLIYEGDILQFTANYPHLEDKRILRVFYKDFSFRCWDYSHKDWHPLWQYDTDVTAEKIEIIGNIYQDSYLLNEVTHET